MVLGRITRGRNTHNPGGRHSIRTNQQSTSINPFFMPDALPVATLPIYPGLGQAQEYAGLHIPMAWFRFNWKAAVKKKLVYFNS